MPQSGTFGSVRGEAGAAMVTLHGHAAGNGGHGQGNPTAATGPLLLGSQGVISTRVYSFVANLRVSSSIVAARDE